MQKLNIPLPSLGLVVDKPAEYVDERSVVGVKNMEFNRSIIRKRCGTTAAGAALTGTDPRIQRLFELQVGSTTRLFRVGITKIEALDTSTMVWSDVTGGTPLAAGSASDMISYTFALLGGVKKAIISNGKDPIRKVGISGNTANLAGSPPKAKFVRAFGPYLVLAYVIDGGNTYYTRVQWSDTGDPETWSGANTNAGSQDLLDDPEDITGLGVFGNLLTIHKSRSIWVAQLVTTSRVFQFSRKATGIGACTEAVIQNLPSGEQIFLASDGIHLFNGITAPLISSPVQDELREGMNPAVLYKAQSIFVEELDEYWVCVAMGSDTEPRTVYKYNWRTQQIYKDDRTNLTALGLFLNTISAQWDDFSNSWDSQTSFWDAISVSNLNPTVLVGKSDGTVTKRSVSSVNDSGVAIEGVWDTKDFTAQDFQIPDIDRIMRWKGLQVWAKGTSVDVYYSTDRGSSWTKATTLTLTSDYSEDSAPLNVYFDAASSSCRFRFVNTALVGGFTLKKYQIYATVREARK